MFHLDGVTPNSFKLTKIVNPEDKNDVLLFDGRGYSGSSFRARDNDGNICTFKELNEFISTKMTKDERLELYKIYSDIDNYFDNSNQNRRNGGSNIVNTFESGLSRHLAKLVNHVKFKDVKDFYIDLYKRGDVKVPDDIKEEHQLDGKIQQKHIDCTYLLPDYLDAMSMILYMRLFIPVWGRYLPLTRYDGKYALKEYHALKLITGTTLFKEHVFTRLDTYIRGITNIEDDISVFVAGLSNEEIPFLLMSQIVVKRFPIYSLSYVVGERNTHLMSMMYHLVGDGGKSGQLGKLIKNMVFEKKPVETEWSDEDNSSVLDMYKSRELVPAGDLAITEVYLKNYCHGDDPELTKLCYDYIKEIDLSKIVPSQIKLMTWVIATLIPGNVVPLFEGPILRRALAIVQSQLYSWGFSELAILLTAEPIEFESGTYMSNLGHKPISNDRKQALDRLYGVDSLAGFKGDNVGIVGIQNLSRVFFESDWGVNCPKELYKDDEDLNLSPIFSTHGDIRNMLADLLVKLSTAGING